ncbi:hypothetical protein HDE_06665 [Halotydeus destructor]|nr:hypothetical protein HDE_06665 [Halotydeus destructor]
MNKLRSNSISRKLSVMRDRSLTSMSQLKWPLWSKYVWHRVSGQKCPEGSTWYLDDNCLIHHAILSNNHYLLSNLLESGMNPNHNIYTHLIGFKMDSEYLGTHKINDCAPLHLAVLKGNQRAVDLLVYNMFRTVDINLKTGPTVGYTALHIAVRLDNVHMVKKLLSAGADGITIADDKGETAFETACYSRKNMTKHIFNGHRCQHGHDSVIRDYMTKRMDVKVLQEMVNLTKDYQPWMLFTSESKQSSIVLKLVQEYEHDNIAEVAELLMEVDGQLRQSTICRALEEAIYRRRSIKLIMALYKKWDKITGKFSVNIAGVYSGRVNFVGLILMCFNSTDRSQLLLSVLADGSQGFMSTAEDVYLYAINSPLTTIEDLYLLMSANIPLKSSHLDLVLIHRRIDLLDWFLSHVPIDKRDISKSKKYKFMMSQIAFTTKDGDYHHVVNLLKRLKEEFDCNQNEIGFYPYPIMHLLAFKYSLSRVSKKDIAACLEYIFTLPDTDFTLKSSHGQDIFEFCDLLDKDERTWHEYDCISISLTDRFEMFRKRSTTVENGRVAKVSPK